MTPNLKPIEPLSQVVFIHDYFQLIFQDEGFSIYNIAELLHQGTPLRLGQPGFCDALVSLIDQRVTSVSTQGPDMLSLNFERGSSLRVLTNDGATNNPEAFEFRGRNNLLVVEPNA